MLKTKIESLLFASNKPLTKNFFVKFLRTESDPITLETVENVLLELKEKFNQENSGINLIEAADGWQLTTSAQAAEEIKKFSKDEIDGELTPASLETLTVIAYRGPIARPELEQLRGVNCSVILRNLQIRGLITAFDDQVKKETYFEVTTDFLKHLGMTSVKDLPDYEKLKKAQSLEDYLTNNN